MKIAALYDIHGNLPALNAILAELEEIQPDMIVQGGDLVSGPMPKQTLERLHTVRSRVYHLRGNADREVVMAFDGVLSTSDIPEEVYKQTHWVSQQLGQSERDFLAQLPENITLHVEGLGDVLFCHATPRNDEEIFTPITPQSRLDTIFAGVQQPYVICGHTHIQFERQVGNTRILNAGSVGMPYADAPGAYWMLLSPESVEFRRTAYDVEQAANDIGTTNYPQAKEFAEENVRVVPTSAEATEVFEQMAEKQ